MSARKINQLLERDNCTLEELLAEEDFCVQQCKQSNPKLLEFMCQKENLTQLIKFATLPPEDESHTIGHKYPFIAMEILTSCKQIASAICEGGYPQKSEPEDDEDEDPEHRLVRDLTKVRLGASPLIILIVAGFGGEEGDSD